MSEVTERTFTPVFPEWVDSTALDDFSSCEQKWLYSTILRLEPAVPNIHLHSGKVFAKGLEVVRRAVFETGLSLEEGINLAKYAMIVEWEKFEPRFSWDGQGPKALDALMDAVEFYFATWPPATDHIQPLMVNDKAAVEFTICIPLTDCLHPVTGQPILLTGRFDMLGKYNDAVFVEDDKTASQLGSSWGNQWTMRAQFSAYCWAAREYGYPVAGTIVRGVSFLKNGFGSAEAITYREDWKLDRWLVETKRKYARMVEIWNGLPPVLNLGEACCSYSGCPFVPLCDSPNPEKWYNTYVERVWNPLARL